MYSKASNYIQVCLKVFIEYLNACLELLNAFDYISNICYILFYFNCIFDCILMYDGIIFNGSFINLTISKTDLSYSSDIFYIFIIYFNIFEYIQFCI